MWGKIRHNSSSEVVPVRLAARLCDKELAERMRVFDLPYNAVLLQHCSLEQGMQDWNACSFKCRELWARSRMIARRLGSFCQGCAFRARVQHVPSQVRRRHRIRRPRLVAGCVLPMVHQQCLRPRQTALYCKQDAALALCI